jgi:hypothetical protein
VEVLSLNYVLHSELDIEIILLRLQLLYLSVFGSHFQVMLTTDWEISIPSATVTNVMFVWYDKLNVLMNVKEARSKKFFSFYHYHILPIYMHIYYLSIVSFKSF